MQDWKLIKEAIAEAVSIDIFTHIHADGDCLGSAFALAYFLCDNGKKVRIINEEIPPRNLSYIYGGQFPAGMEFFVWNESKNVDFSENSAELCIAVDVSDVKRLGERQQIFYNASKTIRIDHHITTESFAQITVCNPEWAATAEGMWEFLTTYDNFEKLPHITEIAKSIYAGILTDTGCFAYSNVTAQTHKIAAKLIEIAGGMSWQYSAVYENQTKGEIALKALAYGKVEYYAQGRIAYLHITKADMEETGTNDEHLNGLAPFLRCIEGVNVGILVKPGKRQGEHRISLRSDETCDVNVVASVFNGGGHKRAAGLVYSPESGLSFDEYKEKLIGEVQKWMA
ncbi:MAG: hypothetical protein E7387_05025 [Ruminococcaceae bacterium]|nr:hypothetical protein [Oscillospiraceae bacterium]